MKTFGRETWEMAQAAWTDGGFSPEWRDLRHVMALNGAIFPPAGTALDSWDDDPPSQRAIIIRAIRDTPELLRRSAIGCPSWSVLVVRLMRAVNEWRDDVRRAEVEPDDQPTHREAVQRIAAIMSRIADSAGLER